MSPDQNETKLVAVQPGIMINNNKMLAFLCIWVHDGAVCLAVSSLRLMCSGSRRSCVLIVAAIWNHIGKSVVLALLFLYVFFFPLLSIVCRCLDDPVWGLTAGLQGLLAMGAFYCLGAG